MPSAGVCVLIARRCVCASRRSSNTSTGSNRASSHGAMTITGPGAPSGNISAFTIVCIHVVPHLDGVHTKTSPGRWTKCSHRRLSETSVRYSPHARNATPGQVSQFEVDSALHSSVPLAPFTLSTSCAADQHVVPVRAHDRVVPGAAGDEIVAVAGVDRVVLAAAVDDVVAVAACDRVLAAEATQQVVAVPAGRSCRRRRSRGWHRGRCVPSACRRPRCPRSRCSPAPRAPRPLRCTARGRCRRRGRGRSRRGRGRRSGADRDPPSCRTTGAGRLAFERRLAGIANRVVVVEQRHFVAVDVPLGRADHLRHEAVVGERVVEIAELTVEHEAVRVGADELLDEIVYRRPRGRRSGPPTCRS